MKKLWNKLLDWVDDDDNYEILWASIGLVAETMILIYVCWIANQLFKIMTKLGFF